MNALAKQTAEMLSILPDEEILLVNALVRKLIIAWDPDFTKVTPEERRKIEEADWEMKNGEFFTEEDVWGSNT